MTLLPALAFAIGLVGFGAHFVWPLRSDRAPQSARLWACLALPIAVGAVVALLAVAGTDPDNALAAGVAPALPTQGGKLAAVLLGTCLLADAVLLIAALAAPASPIEPLAWRLVAGLGLGGLLGWAWIGEALRIGGGPPPPLQALLLAIACRAVAGLGAGEALSPGRPWCGPFAAIALLLYPLTLPRDLYAALVAGRDVWTLWAAAGIFALARWVGARYRRAALLAAALLAGIWFARCAELQRMLSPALPIYSAGAPVPAAAPGRYHPGDGTIHRAAALPAAERGALPAHRLAPAHLRAPLPPAGS